jgi:hypothetical protein
MSQYQQQQLQFTFKVSNLIEKKVPKRIEHETTPIQLEEMKNLTTTISFVAMTNHQIIKWMEHHGLPVGITKDSTSKWTIAYNGGGTLLFQCQAGRTGYKKTVTAQLGSRAYEYVGCCAYIQLLRRRGQDGKLDQRNDELGFFDEAFGVFQHSSTCQRLSPISDTRTLDVSLKQRIIKMLHDGLPASKIISTCQDVVAKRGPLETLDPRYRYVIQNSDISTLRKAVWLQKTGLSDRVSAEFNLDGLFGGKSGDDQFTSACFHYVPKSTKSDRLFLGLSTKQQCELAWKHGHQKMIFMDGTFGVSKHRILLFMMLVIDGSGKGVPVAQFIFTPPPNVKNTSSNYDGRILEHFLRSWVEHLNKNRPDNISVTSFEPLVSVLCNTHFTYYLTSFKTF